MERSEVTRAAAQADEAEHQLALLQRRFQEEQETAAMKISELETLLGPLETARLNQTAQIDDIQFRLEEEIILRTDAEVFPFIFMKYYCSALFSGAYHSYFRLLESM